MPIQFVYSVFAICDSFEQMLMKGVVFNTIKNQSVVAPARQISIKAFH